MLTPRLDKQSELRKHNDQALLMIGSHMSLARREFGEFGSRQCLRQDLEVLELWVGPAGGHLIFSVR